MHLHHRSSWQVAGWLSTVTFAVGAAALAGCAASRGNPEDGVRAGESSEALVSSGTFFPDPSIRYCFETPGHEDFKARFASGVEQTFQNYTNVALHNAGDCADTNPSGNLVRVTLEDGDKRSYTNIAARTMHIFTASGPVTWAHEFTHALGFLHTQDANGSLCTLQAVTSQDGSIGPYDPDSLMNYCGSGGPKVFSDLDLMGIDLVYGAPGVLSVDAQGTMYRHRVYRKVDGSQVDYRCTLQGAAQLAAFTGLHGAPAGSADSSYSQMPLDESLFHNVTPTDVGPCAYPPGFYRVEGIGEAEYMVAGDQIEVDPASDADGLHVNPGKICRIADGAQRQYFSVGLLVHTVPEGTELWDGRAATRLADTPLCAWGDGFYQVNGTDPVYRLSGTPASPSICHVVSSEQLSQYQQVGRVVTLPQPPLAGEVNVAVPPHLLPTGTPLSTLTIGRSPSGSIPDCDWPDGLYQSNGVTYAVTGKTYCRVIDPVQLAGFRGPTPSDVTGQMFFQTGTAGPFSGSGSNGGSGARCLGTYSFPVTAGTSYTISTLASFTGDTYLVVSGACSCMDDDYGGGLGSQCTCTATTTGTATVCASSYSGSAASWNYTAYGSNDYTSTGDCGWPPGYYRSQNGRFRVLDSTSVCFVQGDAQLAALNLTDADLTDATGDDSFYHFWQRYSNGYCPWPDGLYTQGGTTYALGTGAKLPHPDVIAGYGVDRDPIGDMCALVNFTQVQVLGSTLGTTGGVAWPLFDQAPVAVSDDAVLTVGRTLLNPAQQVPWCPWPNGNYHQGTGPGSDAATYTLTRTGASRYDGTISYDCWRDVTTDGLPTHVLPVTVPQAIWQCPLAPAQMPPLTVTCSDAPCKTTSLLYVHYEGMTGSNRDWIAPVPLGQPSDQYVGKQYLADGPSSGDLVFHAPGPGTWTFRGFINGSYVVRSESAPVVIVPANPGLLQLSCPDTPCTDASTLVASYAGAPSDGETALYGYTVQLMPPGGAPTSVVAYQYVMPSSASLSFDGGSLAFPASTPAAPSFPVTGYADLVARLYSRGSGTELAESEPVRLWPNLTVTCSTPLCAAGDTVTVTYRHLPAVNAWIELVPQGTAHATSGILVPGSAHGYFTYTSGLVSGSVTFTVRAGDTGPWVARAYKPTAGGGLFGGLTVWLQTGLDSAPISLGN